ncbi:MAG: hypothetical protein GX868_05290 [Actinobacteria bacterium]|nr:hypothetical protein [Actinomycetota bacterium]
MKHSFLRPLLASVVAVGALGASLVTAPTASAQYGADLRVNGQKEITLTGNGPWTVHVTGTNYTAPAVAPSTGGGVYVLFGEVKLANWGPSHRGSGGNGLFGHAYTYGGDADYATRSDDGSGLNRFAAFYPVGADANATDFFMTLGAQSGITRPGSFGTGRSGANLTITIPSPVFTYVNPMNDQPVTVDCRTANCGVYTIGAHGVAERANEQFVRIKFAAGGDSGGGNTGGSAGGSTPGGNTGGATTPGSTGNAGAVANGGGAKGGGAKGGAAAPTPTTLSPAQAEELRQRLLAAKAQLDAEAAAAAEAALAAEAAAAADAAGVAAETSIADPGAVEDAATDTTTTTKKATEVARGAETVTVNDADGGSVGLVAGLAIGIPVLAAGGVLVWRRKAAEA